MVPDDVSAFTEVGKVFYKVLRV